jgi:hypothetical protein
MMKFIHIFALLKIVPVQHGNFSQFRQLSLPSLAAFIIWFLVPASLIALGEVIEAADITTTDKSTSLLMSVVAYSTLVNMGLILLAGPQLLGLLTRKCSSLLDMELLPLPKRQWMILLSTPLPAIAMLVSEIEYALKNMNENSLFSQEVAFILKLVPRTVLAAMSSIVLSSMLIIMSSVLTHMLSSIKELKSNDANVDLFWTTIDTYCDICNQLGPFFLLLFPLFCSTIMIMAFYVYEFITIIGSVVYSCTFMFSGTLVLFHVTLIANDCEDAFIDLRHHYRQVTSNQI